MQVNITGHHVTITPALKTHVEEKLQKVQHIFQHITQVHVTLTVEKSIQKAEAELHLAGSQKPLFAKHSSNDMYASIDSLEKKLCKLVTKHKEKLKDHGGNSI